MFAKKTKLAGKASKTIYKQRSVEKQLNTERVIFIFKAKHVNR